MSIAAIRLMGATWLELLLLMIKAESRLINVHFNHNQKCRVLIVKITGNWNTDVADDSIYICGLGALQIWNTELKKSRRDDRSIAPGFNPGIGEAKKGKPPPGSC